MGAACCGCCRPDAGLRRSGDVAQLSRREKDGLLSMYGAEELTEVRARARQPSRVRARAGLAGASALTRVDRAAQSDEEELAADNPMTPEQIQALIARQIALTQETDDDVDSTPPRAPFTTPPPKAAAATWGSRMAKTEPSADLPPIPPPHKSTPG